MHIKAIYAISDSNVCKVKFDKNIIYILSVHRLLKDIKSNVLCPGDVTTYFLGKVKINCLFTSSTAYFTSLEKGFKNIKKGIRSYRNFALQSGPIKPVDNFKYISRTVSILRSIINGSELWLCGDTDQIKEKEIYENYCRTVINEVRLVSRPTAVSNRPKAGGPKQRNASSNNQVWKNSPTKKNRQKR
jgi:hypothetical protein